MNSTNASDKRKDNSSKSDARKKGPATEDTSNPAGPSQPTQAVPEPAAGPSTTGKDVTKSRRKRTKLAPQRPYPTVPTSVSATGPRSAHTEGKNYICLTRKTPLGAYLRRCKDVVLKDGYKTLYLSALGAAIPHLMQLIVSLPSVLPYAAEEMRTEVRTGTVEVIDEVEPPTEDEDADVSYETRGKSSLSVVFIIGDGAQEIVGGTGRRERGPQRGGRGGENMGEGGSGSGRNGQGKGKERAAPAQIVFAEPEQGEMDVS
ncbi:hypothetical protein PLICRDRAFT_124417 [Plicaturopsis crispa FD-325 SS-3]|nr:hypothetical protein PLICRDRAFT_124417 [Plicaturopsis crispa FD-325 SS-3]